ncbi:MFS transporter [Bacillus taeanensis]|uniref:MFS transporter n=1 Tax=Bacillus taeanensis TaxID=273032 RepID=UPI0015F070A0|nr:MFS transporter [Bacillus taeanensis]
MKHSLFPLYLVSFAQLLAMLIWFNYSAILPIIKKEWMLSPDESGLLLSAFQLGYVISVFVLGYLSDRIRPRLIFIVSAIIAGIGGLLFGLCADDFWSGFLFRMLAGIGLGGIYVPGLKYLSGVYPPNKRGKIFGIYVGALVVGSGGALLCTSSFITFLGWREVVVITSVGAFIAAGMMFCYRIDPPLPEKPPKFSKVLLKSIINNKKLVKMNIAYTGHNWELYAFWGWIGPFMVYVTLLHGYSLPEAQVIGNLWGGLFIVIGGIGTWIGGELSDKVGRIGALKPLLAVGMICSLSFGWLADIPYPVIVGVGIIYGITVVGDSPVYSAAISELSPPHMIGLSLGIQQVLGYSITVISPSVFGGVLAFFESEALGWGAAFSILALGSIVSLLILPKKL